MSIATIRWVLSWRAARASLVDACYRYDRYAPVVDVVLTGTGSIAHLKDNLRSISDKPLPAPVIDRLTKIFGRVTSISAD